MKFDFGVGKAKNIHMWPFVTVINETEFRKTDILSGLFDYQKHSGTESYTKSHLFPLYWYNDRKGKSFRLLSLYYPSLYHYEYTRTDSTHTYSFLELVPGLSFLKFSSSYQGTYSDNNLLFLLWYRNNKRIQKSHFVFFPAVWYYRNGARHSFTFFPLVSFGRLSPTHTYFGITPLFWHISEQNYRRNVFFPIFWHKKSGEGDYQTRNTVLFPLLYSFKNHYHNNKVLFPLIYSLDDDQYKSFTFIPLFSAGHAKHKQASHFAVTCLYWHFTDTTGHNNALFPIWWNGAHQKGTTYDAYNIYFPLFWSVIHRYKYYSYKASTEHDSILTARYTVLFPFYWNMNHPDYHSKTIFPIYSSGRSTDGKESHYSVAAIFWHFKKPKQTHDVLFPLYWSGKSNETYDSSSYHVFFPLLWTYKWHSSYSSHYGVDSAKVYRNFKNNHVLFPLVWSFKNEKKKSFTIFPVYFQGSTANGVHSHLDIFPLFFKTREGKSRSSCLFPIYYYRKDSLMKESDLVILPVLFGSSHTRTGRSVNLIGPLIKYAKDSCSYIKDGVSITNDYFRIAPIFWYRKEGDTKIVTVFPLYSYHKTKTSLIHHVIWPIYRDKEVFGKSKKYSILWQLYTFEKDSDGGTAARFLYRFYSNVHQNGGTELSAFLLFYNSTNKDGSFYKSYLLSFYNYRKQKIRNTNYYYQEQRIFWLLRLRSNYRGLKEKGVVTRRRELR